MVDDEMSKAVVAFVGSPGVLTHVEPEERVRALLGDRAVDVLPRIQAMLAGLYSATPPVWNAGDLHEMARDVEQWLREHHPGPDERAVAAVAKAYTFDQK